MQLRLIFRTCAATAGLALSLASAPSALAQEPGVAPPGPDTRPEWHSGHASPAPAPHPPRAMIEPQRREQWLSECRRRLSAHYDGLGGAVIGGIVGGFAGNRLAGRHHRTTGTLVGAAAGAAAGMAIDKAEDSGRAPDQCETYLNEYIDYYTYYGAAAPAYGYRHAIGHGHGGHGCCHPMAAPPPSRPECTETVEYEYDYVPVRPKARHIPRKRTKVVPDKRIRIQ